MQQNNEDLLKNDLFCKITNIINYHKLQTEPIKICNLITLSEEDFDSFVFSIEVNLTSTNQAARFVEYLKIIKDKLSPSEKMLVMSDYFESAFYDTFCKDLQNVSLQDSFNELKTRVCHAELISLTSSLDKNDSSKIKKAMIFSVYFAEQLPEYFQYLKYAIKNKLYLTAQMIERSIPPSRIQTFSQWKKEKIHINKGEKSFGIIIKKKASSKNETYEKDFIFKKCLFSQYQTNSINEIQKLQPVVCQIDPNQIVINLVNKYPYVHPQDIIVAFNLIYIANGGIQENPSMIISLINDEKTSMENIVKMIDEY